jgi:hypothetical protein
MKKPVSGFGRRSSLQYLKKRGNELATPAMRATSEPLAAWAVKWIRLDGRPFSFDGHAYLRPIFDDTSQHIVLSKAAQIGGTTWAILKSIHACRQGLNVGYYFPTKTDVLEFSKSRVAPLLAENPALRGLVRDTNTAGLKQIGEAYLYLRGMQSTVGMKSIPVDMLVFDELDEATPEAKAMARERLGHSDYKRILELSNPSLPDYGIDEVYQKSDQRHWTMKCPACGAWTCLEKEFPQKLGQDVRIIRPRPDGTFYRACAKCEAELDLDAGEWVADWPGLPIHGYRISQLFSSKVDPGEILAEYRTTRYPDRFYNLKIGIPWADRESRLDTATVLALCTDRPMPDKTDGRRVMGVDTGKDLHAVILFEDDELKTPETYNLVHLEECGSFEELDALIARFKIETCVIDGMPELHSTRAFAKRHRGKVFMNFFNENQRGKPKFDRDESIVTVNRTEALDASRAAIRDQRVRLPRRDALVETFARHMSNDAKVLEEDETTGAKKFRYQRTGVDHFSLAFTYAWLAATDLTGAWAWIRYMRDELRRMNERSMSS